MEWVGRYLLQSNGVISIAEIYIVIWRKTIISFRIGKMKTSRRERNSSHLAFHRECQTVILWRVIHAPSRLHHPSNWQSWIQSQDHDRTRCPNDWWRTGVSPDSSAWGSCSPRGRGVGGGCPAHDVYRLRYYHWKGAYSQWRRPIQLASPPPVGGCPSGWRRWGTHQ